MRENKDRNSVVGAPDATERLVNAINQQKQIERMRDYSRLMPNKDLKDSENKTSTPGKYAYEADETIPSTIGN